MEQAARIEASGSGDFDLQAWIEKCYQSLSDNFNSPILIAHLFEAIKLINQNEGSIALSASDLSVFKEKMNAFVFDILGLQMEEGGSAHSEALDKAMDLVIELRAKARENKDWGTADLIRDQLSAAGIKLKDGAEGTSYEI